MAPPTSSGTPDMIDWDLAVATGTRLVRPGPNVTRAEATAVVADLRRHAADARAHVRAHTGLVVPTDDALPDAAVLPDADGLPGAASDASGIGSGAALAVIDRPGWIRANAEGFRTLLDPLVDRLQQRRADAPGSAAAGAVGAKVTAVETGSILAFLAGKVLGQYELFPPYGSGGERAQGRLLLVAPNIVAAEREMGVDARDFRLWVCIHEETHRVQFGAVPWLRDHLIAELGTFLEATDVDPAALLRRVGAAVGAVGDAVRGRNDSPSLVEAVQTPAQREVLDRLTAVMSLLEGHADVVMDDVGPQVIPSVATIRARFQQRRESASRPEQIFRRLIGLDAKMRQYRDGARFVRGVVDRVGMDGFNRVWTSPETLPRPDELTDPAAWVARVHPAGLPAAGETA